MIFPVKIEIFIIVYVFFNENQARWACFFVYSQIFGAILQTGNHIFIRKIHKKPLNPNTVVFMLKFKILKALTIKVFHVWYLNFGLFHHNRALVENVNFFESIMQQKFRDSSYACSYFKSSIGTW